jgi:rod shape-determining protein MreC
MRRLLIFIKRFYFLIIFIAFEAIGLTLLISNNRYHHAVFFNAFDEVSGNMYQRYTNILMYFSLKKENEQLLTENAILHSQVASAYSKLSEFNVTSFDTSKNYKFIFKPANVVYNSIQKRNNFLTLNIGSKQGISEKMGVVSDFGVVGIVKGVSENYSVVISILNEDFRLNAKIQELNEVGSIIWDGKHPDKVVLNEIPNHVKIKTGQHIVVGPYSRFFSENYPIGIIESFTLENGASFYEIVVRLNTNMRSVSKVYIIKRTDLEEQINLEQKEEKND